MKQKTLINSYSVRGKVLHSGLNITDTKYNAATSKGNRS